MTASSVLLWGTSIATSPVPQGESLQVYLLCSDPLNRKRILLYFSFMPSCLPSKFLFAFPEPDFFKSKSPLSLGEIPVTLHGKRI